MYVFVRAGEHSWGVVEGQGGKERKNRKGERGREGERKIQLFFFTFL